MPVSMYALDCDICGEETEQERLISAPAPYMGERLLNPIVRGGSYDTAGDAPMPSYPDAPGEAEHVAKIQSKLSALGQDAPQAERYEAMASVASDAPDIISHMGKPECIEIKKERKRIGEQNIAKKQRLRALKRGENVNMRRDRLAGDPKLTA